MELGEAVCFPSFNTSWLLEVSELGLFYLTC